jgi:hypothetical protein
MKLTDEEQRIYEQAKTEKSESLDKKLSSERKKEIIDLAKKDAIWERMSLMQRLKVYWNDGIDFANQLKKK